MSPQKHDDSDKRKKMILIAVCAALAVAAGVVYYLGQGGEPPPPEPALFKAEAVQKSVQEASQAGSATVSSDIERTAPRRSVTPDGK